MKYLGRLAHQLTLMDQRFWAYLPPGMPPAWATLWKVWSGSPANTRKAGRGLWCPARLPAAQGIDAAARNTHVAQKLLNQARSADILYANTVLRPAQGVDYRTGLVGLARGGVGLVHAQQVFLETPVTLETVSSVYRS